MAACSPCFREAGQSAKYILFIDSDDIIVPLLTRALIGRAVVAGGRLLAFGVLFHHIEYVRIGHFIEFAREEVFAGDETVEVLLAEGPRVR